VTVHPGRKVYYCRERHGGQQLIRPGGILGRLAGTLRIDPDDSRVKNETNHTVRESGFGAVVEMAARAARAALPGQVRLWARVVEAGEPARVVVLPRPPFAGAAFGRTELAISERTGLPLRLASWTEGGELFERFLWARVEVDPPLSDRVDFSLGYQ